MIFLENVYLSFKKTTLTLYIDLPFVYSNKWVDV